MPFDQPPTDQTSDDELLEGLRAGSRTHLDALTQRYWDAIRRFCANFLRDEALADDVAQETFAKLADIDRLPEGAIRPWLYALARNRCLDIARRHGRSPTHHNRIHTRFDAAGSSAGPRTQAHRNERSALIREIIDQMPDEYRDVLLLKYYEGLSREEIAAALETTDAAVKGRLVRATKHLETELRKLTDGTG